MRASPTVVAPQQFFRVGGDAQDPLAQFAAFHRMVAAFGFAIDNFFIGQDRSQGPVYRPRKPIRV